MARKVEGEGSYTASKDYNERTRKFIDSGKVEDAARDAEPKSEEEKHAMQKAERIGRQIATLPLFPRMADADVDRVCEAAKKALS